MKTFLYRILASGIIVSFILSCNINYYNGYNNRNGVFMEIPKDTVSYSRYTDNNKVYTAGDKYILTYTYLDASGTEYLFAKESSDWDNKNWHYIDKDSSNSLTCTKIIMEVLPDSKDFIQKFDDYSQSLIQYTYLNKNDSVFFRSTTGLVENPKNIWLHPPRAALFRIIQINPYPFIQKPYRVGNQWYWSLKIGDIWGDSRWKQWKGIIENQYQYEITAKKRISTRYYDNIRCIVTEAKVSNTVGEAYLTSYFNRSIGFVKYSYINIDNTKMIIEVKKENDIDNN